MAEKIKWGLVDEFHAVSTNKDGVYYLCRNTVSGQEKFVVYHRHHRVCITSDRKEAIRLANEYEQEHGDDQPGKSPSKL